MNDLTTNNDGRSRRRIIPWKMFHGSMVPNWLQRRAELSQGAKLAYGRLMQYAGENGDCFPRQKTLANELGVSERTANEYIRALLKFKLIERERPGLGRSNRYFFLDHPWIHEDRLGDQAIAGQERRVFSAQDQKDSAGQELKSISAPYDKEIQEKRDPEKREHTHKRFANEFPATVVEAVETARQLGIEEEFARQEFYTKKAVGWKDGYGNTITSWRDHLQARWPVEQRKRTERRTTGRGSPPRQFAPKDYNQPVKDF